MRTLGPHDVYGLALAGLGLGSRNIGSAVSDPGQRQGCHLKIVLAGWHPIFSGHMIRLPHAENTTGQPRVGMAMALKRASLGASCDGGMPVCLFRRRCGGILLSQLRTAVCQDMRVIGPGLTLNLPSMPNWHEAVENAGSGRREGVAAVGPGNWGSQAHRWRLMGPYANLNQPYSGREWHKTM